MNVVHLIGYLGRDPEPRSFANGDRVASLSLATHRRLPPDERGQRRDKTDWHRVRVYGPAEGGMVELVLTGARKGSRLQVTGELTTAVLVDAEGRRSSVTFVDVRPGPGHVELLDPPRRSADATAPEAPNSPAAGPGDGASGDGGRRGGAAAQDLAAAEGLLGDDL
jgi:single-strand DNA-binding protein